MFGLSELKQTRVYQQGHEEGREGEAQLLRLDAALYQPAPTRHPRQIGRPRLKGQRLPTSATVLSNPSFGKPL